MQEYNSLYTV